MSEILEALVLGIVQGLTEFLPVSSSGHLEIFKYIMGDDSYAEQSMLTTVFLHFATAIATLFVFRNDVIAILKGLFSKSDPKDRLFSAYILVSMIPAVFVGLYFDDLANALFDKNLILVGVCLIITACLLWLSESLKPGKLNLNFLSAGIIGVAQAIAILPGISRSGATLASSLLLGLDKSQAARFSFLMVVPLIFGKIAKDLLSGDFTSHMPNTIYLLTGFFAALISGIWACKAMIKLVKAARLHWFSYYCLIAGIVAIIISL